MRRNLLAVILVASAGLTTAGGCRTPLASGEIPGDAGRSLRVPFDARGWYLATNASDPGKAGREYLPLGQSRAAWSESVTGTFISRDLRPASLDQELERFKAGVRQVCPGSAQWRVLRRSADELVYEMRLAGCERQPDQTELGRFLVAPEGMYRAAFVAKGPPLPAERRDRWLAILSDARLSE